MRLICDSRAAVVIVWVQKLLVESAVWRAPRKCHRKASSSLTWGLTSALEVVAAVQLSTLGLVYVNACRWDGQDRMRLLVTWRHLLASDGHGLWVFVARDGGRWCMSSVVDRRVHDSASYCQFSIV